MSVKKTKTVPDAPSLEWGPESLRGERVQLIVTLVVAVLLIATVWAVPRPIGDLYVAYAGGRDILNGKLGTVDDWCFNTYERSRVWFNQNWGTHLLYYLTFLGGGEIGIVVLKLAILLVGGLFIVLLARHYGTHLPAAVLVAGIILFCGHAFIDLRPNLITLMFSPVMLWMLHRTEKNPQRIWWAVGFLVLWANMHGGYMLGLGMIGLWALCNGGAAMIHGGYDQGATKGITGAFRRLWPLAVAAVAAVVLPAIITPFGHHNLTHPFVVGKSAAWREVLEWNPVWALNQNGTLIQYGTTWEFLDILLVLGALLLSRWLLRLRDRTAAVALTVLLWCVVIVLGFVIWFGIVGVTRLLGSFAGSFTSWHTALAGGGILPWLLVLAVAGVVGWRVFLWLSEGPGRGALLFDILLGCLLVAMGFKARRFIPLATISIAAMLAKQLDWFLAKIRGRWLLVVLAAGMLYPAWTFIAWDWRFYSPRNPFYASTTQSLYRKMIRYDLYTQGGAEFLKNNHIAGRMVHEWRWEGFLRWRSVDGSLPPEQRLQLYVGGRAQQVHPVEDYELRKAIWGGYRTVEFLDALGVEYVASPLDPQSTRLLTALYADPKNRWVIVYYDSRRWDHGSIILANALKPRSWEVIRRVVEGKMWYPDEGTGVISRALCLASPASGANPRTAFEALKAANRLEPDRAVYAQILDLHRRRKVSDGELKEYLESEQQRLAGMKREGREEVLLIPIRGLLAEKLAVMYAQLAKRAQAPEQKAMWEQKFHDMQRVLGRLKGRSAEIRRQWQ